jgi:hypothetical protein
MLVSMLVVTVFAPLIAPYMAPATTSPDSLAGPSAAHWLGTDSIGRDVLSRLIIGGRTTLLITFVAVSIAVAAGLVLGLLSGYVGGLVDETHHAHAGCGLRFPGVPAGDRGRGGAGADRAQPDPDHRHRLHAHAGAGGARAGAQRQALGPCRGGAQRGRGRIRVSPHAMSCRW